MLKYHPTLLLLIHTHSVSLQRYVRTYLPERKKLWGKEEPVATKLNREKIAELDKELKVSNV